MQRRVNLAVIITASVLLLLVTTVINSDNNAIRTQSQLQMMMGLIIHN